MGFLLRGGAFALWLAAIWLLARLFGSGMALGFAAVTAAWVVLVGSIVPRLAHRAFRKGRFGRSALLYRILIVARPSRSARSAVAVSLAACYLGRGDYRAGLRHLDRIRPERLSGAVRAAWLNNRAYAMVRAGASADIALAESERAIAMRPDLTGFRHTRGVALHALGRIDEAIRELDSLWPRHAGGDVSPLLEAERCYDLGLCWSAKGELDYAADYFERARRAAPGSTWAERAAAKLDLGERVPAALADLV